MDGSENGVSRPDDFGKNTNTGDIQPSSELILPHECIKYQHIPAEAVSDEALGRCSRLFSRYYGRWSLDSPIRPGSRIKMSPRLMRQLLQMRDAYVSFAFHEKMFVGYCFSVRRDLQGLGVVTWIKQLVVHADYRNKGVATHLIKDSLDSNLDWAWGIVTANPFGVRALESATQRICEPHLIKTNFSKLKGIADDIGFIKSAKLKLTNNMSLIYTDFFIEHKGGEETMKKVATKPWTLGTLKMGYEWLAFTFREQEEYER